MVSTRSTTTKGQAKLEDFNAGSTTTSANKKSSSQPKSRGQKRKSQDPEPANSAAPRPPRPSAANAAAIKGNTTVSPSLPESSKRRKPNAASLAPEYSEEEGEGKATGRPKPKSGGRNVGAQAKRAVEKQQAHLAKEEADDGEGGGGGGIEDEGDDGNGGGEEEDKGKGDLKLEKPIMINRSPVLQLWGACVAEFLHGEEIKWETCLSIGVAIAALCAVSKGKAIGKIEPKEKTDEEVAKKEDKKQKAQRGSEEYEVMGFPLHVKGGKAQVSGAPKNVSESQLIGKFGGQDNYDRAREAMKKALVSWKGHGEELDKKAFGMYEKFRPSVPSGGGGWGKKGELNLAELENTVKES